MALLARRITGAMMVAATMILTNSVATAATHSLFEITPQSISTLPINGGRGEMLQADGKSWLRIGSASGKAEVTITPPHGEWNLSAAEGIHFRLRNLSSSSAVVRIVAKNPDADSLMNQCRNAVELLPNQTRDFLLRLTRRPDDPTYKPFAPFYMYFKGINVRDNTIDPAHVSQLQISIDGVDVAIGEISTFGQSIPAPVSFFPFIDQYGQYTHGDWPGKIYSNTDFTDRLKEESAQASLSNPNDRDRYGGWANGPSLKATGFFYVIKYQGKWWFVDPDGKLFWSYGPTGVGFGGDVTPVSDRENWFAALPTNDDPLAQFYKNGRNATYQYYHYRPWRGFDIQRANLLRKYGPDYEQKVAEISHARLHAWGFNTTGNWSSPAIYLLRKTPYTVAINYPSALIQFHMPDVYDPGWEPSVRNRMADERKTTANDPWNLGYFIDNERWFGWRPRGAAIGEETLKDPPEQKAKMKFVELLKAKYKSIDPLNTAWGTHYASWQNVLDERQPPNMKNPALLADCGDFGMMFAERYFTVCRSAVKAVAPNNLYLGSRFFGHTDPELVKMASKYCDVISYNIYDNPPDSRVHEYSKLDVPILSSEWGIDSDPLQTPFRDADLKAQTPADRADSMTGYIEHALKLPNVIGAHFFQYRDQPLSGRPDGEASLRGLVNVADTPNFELIQANRSIADHMYQIRAETK